MDESQLHALQAMLVFMPIILLIGAVIIVVPWWYIWKKAGFSPWFCLLMILPFVSLVMLYIMAFSPWKVVPVGQSALGYSYPPTTFPPPQPPSSFSPPQA
jgi:hypothetical protein